MTTVGAPRSERRREMSFRVAAPAKDAATSSTTLVTAVSVHAASASPPSRRLSSRRSSIRVAIRSAWVRILPRNLWAVSGCSIAPSSRASTNPRIEVSGVRSSWEAFATKSRRMSSTLRRSVASLNVRTAPCGAPSAPGKGTAVIV